MNALDKEGVPLVVQHARIGYDWLVYFRLFNGLENQMALEVLADLSGISESSWRKGLYDYPHEACETLSDLVLNHWDTLVRPHVERAQSTAPEGLTFRSL